jgi:pyruvate/2-oxoglutarate/acetoin dehydrogenase E1 component
LQARGIASADELEAINAEIKADAEAGRLRRDAPYPPSPRGRHARLRRRRPGGESMREITLSKAVNEAIAEEMRRDETVFLLGEDVAEAGTPFKVLSGLVEEFGTDRVIDTPISEPGFMGIAVGAAMTGSRPIVDLMFGDFLYLVMDQLCNQAAKTHYMSGGKLKVPMVLRTNLGATRRSAAQHSQSLHALVAHIPGLKVALPSSAYEAKGLLKTAIRDDNPVVIFEDKLMYQDKARCPEEEYLIPFGEANVLREGRDITLVATSSMVQVAEKAAICWLRKGRDLAEVIDPRTIVPLDEETMLDSVRKTSRAIVIDEGHQSFGVTAEIASRLNEKAFYHLDAPVLRMGAMDVPVPFSPGAGGPDRADARGGGENARKLASSCRGELRDAA